MRPTVILLLFLALPAGCGLAGVPTPVPTGPPPRLLPLEQILPAPVAEAGPDTAAALAARAEDLRARAAQP